MSPEVKTSGLCAPLGAMRTLMKKRTFSSLLKEGHAPDGKLAGRRQTIEVDSRWEI
jgi:hypothetical protein